MKYFVLALFLNYKNAWVTFILQYGFENWIIKVTEDIYVKFWNLKVLY